jgi:hypothetical protein
VLALTPLRVLVAVIGIFVVLSGLILVWIPP